MYQIVLIGTQSKDGFAELDLGGKFKRQITKIGDCAHMASNGQATAASATPLLSLSAVVLDTETTGPDAAKARIIQLGAVKLDQGKTGGRKLDMLINPDEPIDPAATRVHGIENADLSDAKRFIEIEPQLDAYIGRRVVIGHSVGYDLTVLRHEYELAGRHWQPPRSLCTRLLTRATGTVLPDYSLDTIAGWLKLDITGRHTAIGDARATAQVFLALVPILRENGIRTLAEAESASRQFSSDVEQEHQAGWEAGIRAPSETITGPGSMAALARIDSYPYRHRVRDVMSKPPVSVSSRTTLKAALNLLIDKGISSVFVEPVKSGGEFGIVTERDILRALHNDPDKGLSEPVTMAMSAPLDAVPEDVFVYRALGRMARIGVRHLGVHNRSGAICGALSSRDLLRQRATDALSIGDGIEQAEDSEALGAVWAELPVVAQSLVSEDVDPRKIASVISGELCALTKRAAELGEMRMAKAGLGPPPCGYAVMVLGSAGRGESLLAMDQDNAIIFENGEPGGTEDQWFEVLGNHIADILHETGVPYCTGGIMASKPDWRMSAANWNVRIRDWIRHSNPEDLLNIDIFFDGLPVHGDLSLGTGVWNEAFKLGHSSPGFQKLMAAVSANVSPPLGWFGRIKTGEGGRVDLKAGGLLPVFSGARVLAIRYDIRKRATPDRLAAAAGKPDTSAEDLNNITEAHKIILGAILEQQLEDIDSGIPLSNRIAVKRLTKEGQAQLRWALEQIEGMESAIGDPIAFG